MSLPFRLRQRVRLVADVGPMPVGSEGIVIGFYAREQVTYVVRFDGAAYEIAAEHLEPVGDEPDEPKDRRG